MLGILAHSMMTATRHRTDPQEQKFRQEDARFLQELRAQRAARSAGGQHD